MAETLTDKVCTPCRGGVPPLTREEANRYLERVHDWGYATASLQTKRIKGLHERDFIMAAKTDRLAGRASAPEGSPAA